MTSTQSRKRKKKLPILPLVANFSSGQTSKQGDPVPQLPASLRSLKINEPAAAACLAPANVSLTAPGNPSGPTISRQFHCMDQLHHFDTSVRAVGAGTQKGFELFPIGRFFNFFFFFDNLQEENESKRLRYENESQRG